MGRVEDRPVTTAMGWTANGATGILQVATAPADRRRGYGAAVTSRAILDGFAAGADLAWLQTSGSGERLYRNLGFRQVEEKIPGVSYGRALAAGTASVMSQVPLRSSRVSVNWTGSRPGTVAMRAPDSLYSG